MVAESASRRHHHLFDGHHGCSYGVFDMVGWWGAMRSKSVVLGDVSFVCPVTGKKCSVGATVRLKPVPIMQMPLVDLEEPNEPYGIRPGPGRRHPDDEPLLDDDQVDAVRAGLIQQEADRDE